MANLAYKLAPWQWTSSDAEFSWTAPPGTCGLLDVRPLPSQMLRGEIGERPYGFFCVDPNSPAVDGETIIAHGDCREIVVTNRIRDAWESALGHRPTGDRLIDLIVDQLDHGDPDGFECCLPWMPTRGGLLNLWLGGHSLVRCRKFHLLADTVHADRVRTMLQRQYRNYKEKFEQNAAELRQLATDVSNGVRLLHHGSPAQAMRVLQDRADWFEIHHYRILDAWCEKYGVDKSDKTQWTRLVPLELRSDARLEPHETVRLDNFNRADQTGLGTSSEGWSWSGGGNIVNNQASVISIGRAEVDVSSDDHACELFCVSGFGQGPTCRHSTTETTFYHTRHNAVIKFVAGVATTIGNPNVTYPQTMQIRADGSDISVYANDVLRFGPFTDTSITGNLRGGVRTSSNGQPADDWRLLDMADLSAQNFDPVAIPSAEVFGTATLFREGDLYPTAFGSATTFGTATIQVEPTEIDIAELGIYDDNQFGLATFLHTNGRLLVGSLGLYVDDQFGVSWVRDADTQVPEPTAVSSEEVFGGVTVTSSNIIAGQGGMELGGTTDGTAVTNNTATGGAVLGGISTRGFDEVATGGVLVNGTAVSDATIYNITGIGGVVTSGTIVMAMVQPVSINPPATAKATLTADVAVNDWTRNDGSTTNIYQAVDDDPANLTDYAQSGLNPSDAVLNMQLSSLAGVPGEKWVYYTYRKDGSGQTALRVELLEAGQLRQYWDHPDVSLEWKQTRQRVTVDVNDWSNLQLRFIVNPVEEGAS